MGVTSVASRGTLLVPSWRERDWNTARAQSGHVPASLFVIPRAGRGCQLIRRHTAALRMALMFADATVALLVLLLVSRARFGAEWELAFSALFNPAWAAIGIYAVGWVAVLYLSGLYRLRARWSLRAEIRGITRAAVWMTLASFTVLFLTDATNVSRLFLLLLFPVLTVSAIATRGVLRLALVRLREQGRNQRFLLILGTGPRAVAFATQVEGHAALGVRIIGFLGEDASQVPPRWRHLGGMDALELVLHVHVVDEVGICLSSRDLAETETLAQLCSDEGKIVRIPIDVPQFENAHRFVEDLDGTAVLSVIQGPDRALALALKRLLDIGIATTALVVLSPIIVLVALYIRVSDGSPVIFRQVRVGMNGRPFTVYKFRSMVKDAESRYAEMAAFSDTHGAAFKMADDPRITRWGRILRKTSIDELPQLWNVIKGEMSLVGPRPAPPREVNLYDIWHRRRLSMKPGITGLWQISSRLDENFDERAKLDLDYIDRWSLWLDMKIALRTLPAVLRSEGH